VWIQTGFHNEQGILDMSKVNVKKPAKKATKKVAKKVSKKAAKKSAKPKRRVCKTKKCMKTAAADQDLCPVCLDNADADSKVLKVTEVEALRFAKLDAELRNDRQALQIFDFKMSEIKDKAEKEITDLSNQRQQVSAAITARKPEYQQLVKALADKYGIEDPSKMTIDPDTCVIRDLSKV
jgi:hypothetical protein